MYATLSLIVWLNIGGRTSITEVKIELTIYQRCILSGSTCSTSLRVNANPANMEAIFLQIMYDEVWQKNASDMTMRMSWPTCLTVRKKEFKIEMATAFKLDYKSGINCRCLTLLSYSAFRENEIVTFSGGQRHHFHFWNSLSVQCVTKVGLVTGRRQDYRFATQRNSIDVLKVLNSLKKGS